MEANVLIHTLTAATGPHQPEAGQKNTGSSSTDTPEANALPGTLLYYNISELWCEDKPHSSAESEYKYMPALGVCVGIRTK